MREANDLKISSAIRRELSSRRVDLSKLKFPVKAGEVSLQGELSFVGLEKTNDEIAIELKFIESSIKNIEGVSNIIFELTNWKKNDSGIWESSASSSNSPFKQLDGEGLVCPECDFVIRFCPCCGKPLVPGAKPGMHKTGAPKPISRKPNLPPIKPIIRKPRPIGAPSGSPISTPSIKSNSPVVPPIAKPVVPPKPETTVTPVKPPLAKNDSEVKTPLTAAEKPVVTNTVTAPAKEPVNAVEKNAAPNTVKDNTPEVKAPAPPATPAAPATPAKPSVAPKPLKPLRPLKPLAGLKPLNKPGVNAAKPVEPTPSPAPAPAPAPVTPAVKTPVEVQTQAPQQPEIPTPPPAPAEPASVQPVETKSNTAFAPLNNPLPDSGAFKPAEPAPAQNSFDSPQSAFNLNTPIPDFMKNEVPDMTQAPQPFGNFPSPEAPQVPDLNFGLNPLGTDTQTQVPGQDVAGNNPIPDLSLDLNTLGNGGNQAPDLDLGLGFDLNMPTSPTPSSIPDLGLNMNSDQGSQSLPDLGMNLNIPDLSQNTGSSAPNTGKGGDNLDIFGSLFQDQNADDGLGNTSPMGGFPAQDDTPLPPMRSATQPSAPSGLSFDNLGDDDTPLPPMKSAQPAAAPKAAPAKKKNDIFDSLFNEINMGGSGGGDGLGNLDLDLEVIPTGDSNGFSSTPSAPAQQNTGNDNPFNLGDSGVLDLDSMLGSGSGSGSGNLGGKDESGTFNLDDFDINSFKL